MTDDEIKVEKNVPMPPSITRYPFRKMNVGDSFFAPGKTGTDISKASQIYKADGLRFTARTVVENGIKGARAWRTK